MRAIDRATPRLVGLAKRVYETPEIGFAEWKTARRVATQFARLGLPAKDGLAVTGLRADLALGRGGPTIAVIGELDGLPVPGHPGADAKTGVAHACGHHAQLGMLLGVATALSARGVADGLAGRVAFIAAPAEELVDLGQRLEMRERGEISFLSGKQEMIRRGVLSDVDMAMMVHTTSGDRPGRFLLGGGSAGHVAHRVRFLGRAAHAGGAPQQGANALQAALVALTAVNTQRETFLAEDVARVHGIITKGGAAVNSVPAEVVYEGRVRGRSTETIDRVSASVIRCYRAGALALGCDAEITTVSGYMPLSSDRALQRVFARATREVSGTGAVRERDSGTVHGGSTDMGDLSQLMPVIHPYVVAANGVGHGDDYLISDYDVAVVAPARAMAATVIDLLWDGAAEARRVLGQFRPQMTRREYLRHQRARMRVELYSGR